jgi:hypothetical protein
VPIPGTDWSWGYGGANPVRYARRTVMLVHGGATQLPYAMLMDDIDKDGATHSYEWRLHTASTNSVAVGANPISVTSASATMSLHLVDPDFSAVTVAYGPFNAGNTDPASTLIRITRSAINPKFTFLMIPRANASPAPVVTRQSLAWGCGATVDWGAGKVDVLIRNDSGECARTAASCRAISWGGGGRSRCPGRATPRSTTGPRAASSRETRWN